MTGPSAADDLAPAYLEARLGYGLPAFAGWGVLTPHGGLSLSDTGSRRYLLGLRLAIRSHYDLSLEGRHQESGTRPADRGAGLQLRMNW